MSGTVFLDYSQQQLDDAYDQAVYAPNSQDIVLRNERRVEEARRRLGEPLRFAYGPSAMEQLDVFQTKKEPAPVVVYVHGGAWRGGSARVGGIAAEMFVSAGAHLVALDFMNVEQTSGSLSVMVNQVRQAFAWLYQNAATFGGDPHSIHLIAHSSGSHLGGCVLITDWERDFGLPADIIKSAVLSSGMYELYPVSLSKRSKYVIFTDDTLEALSPIRHLDKLATPLVVAYGTLETPEFQRQTADFYSAAKAAGKQVELVVGEGYNHFEMLETYSSPFGVLGRAALKHIGHAWSSSYEARRTS